MNPYQNFQENPQIVTLNAEIDEAKNAIRESCYRMGKAYYAAHKDDPEEEMEDDVRVVRDATALIRDHKAKILDLRGLMICPNCRNEISKTITFCNYCGTKLKEPDPALVQQQEQTAVETPLNCDNCGMPLSPGQRFCARCGKPVSLMTPPQPAPQMAQQPFGQPAQPFGMPYEPMQQPAQPIREPAPQPFEPMQQPPQEPFEQPAPQPFEQPQPRICSNCGAEIPDDAKFCAECGAPG